MGRAALRLPAVPDVQISRRERGGGDSNRGDVWRRGGGALPILAALWMCWLEKLKRGEGVGSG